MLLQVGVVGAECLLPAFAGVDGQAVQALQHLRLGEAVALYRFACKLFGEGAEEGALVITVQDTEAG